LTVTVGTLLEREVELARLHALLDSAAEVEVAEST
jgi:hypothetical protein